MTSLLDSEYELRVENCRTLAPTWEEFKDERAFLARPDVQEAGRKCGIVRASTPREPVKPPPEFQPTRTSYTEADVAANPDIWTKKLKVLEQEFLKLRGPEGIRSGMFVVARRQLEPYSCCTKEWRTICDPRRFFWQTRPYQKCAAYGADIPQTAMRPDLECWNFNSETFPCLTQMFRANRTPGVYTPYLYIGSWGTTFGLHPEDKDLYSLNYLHEGDSKFWYGIPSTFSPNVEAFATELLPKEAEACDQFLRHKTLLIEPRYFLQKNIPVFAAEQKAGDLMITFPNAYHYGFNSGFNVAEARNIATEDWLDWGLKAKQCTCKDYASPDVLPIERIVQMAKKCNPVKYMLLDDPVDEAVGDQVDEAVGDQVDEAVDEEEQAKKRARRI